MGGGGGEKIRNLKRANAGEVWKYMVWNYIWFVFVCESEGKSSSNICCT